MEKCTNVLEVKSVESAAEPSPLSVTKRCIWRNTHRIGVCRLGGVEGLDGLMEEEEMDDGAGVSLRQSY